LFAERTIVKQTTRLIGLFAALTLLLSLACPKNVQPEKPAPPTGIASSFIGTELVYTASATDPDQFKVSMRFDWNDGDTSDWSREVNNTDTVQAAHVWHVPNTYYVSVQAKDPKGSTSLWSNWLAVVIKDTVNIPPGIPAITEGPDSAVVGQLCQFKVVGTDGNEDRLYYYVDWGTVDTFVSAQVPSGTEVVAEYAWPDTGTFFIRTQAQDEKGAFSGWSVGREIVISDTLR